ncbi:hypothetical protein [Zooshikella ganghwensis]|uniref:Uncharacterized protein n=1 Tax=Zooshikella ganghwensis TaxID=202772 RepID=A0A4P9VRX2_9GAMM|nr:hypothetical protein [Zooshikella ganghwensis]RDH46358.1 hypothetical protein B9G39_24505 [Zooshikella ganghwensis]
MSIGVLIAIALIFINFKNTNLIYGVGGSLIQLSLFSVLAYFGFFVLILGTVIFILLGMGAKPVYVVNK